MSGANLKKFANSIFSQLTEIEDVIDGCKPSEKVFSLTEFQETVRRKAEASGGDLPDEELSIEKLAEFFKCIDDIPTNTQKRKKAKDLNRTNVQKDDLRSSTLSLINVSGIAEKDASDMSEDYAKSKKQHESLLRKITETEKETKRCQTEINKLHKFITDMADPGSAKNCIPSLFSPQQEAQVKKLDQCMQDIIYIYEDESQHHKIDEQHCIAQNLEVLMPIVDELLQNVNIKL